MNFYLLINSFLTALVLASPLAKVISGIPFLRLVAPAATPISSVSDTLLSQKNFDVYFSYLPILLTLVIYFINTRIFSKVSSKSILFVFYSIIAPVLLFLETTFALHSLKFSLLGFVLIQFITIVLIHNFNKRSCSLPALLNGIIIAIAFNHLLNVFLPSIFIKLSLVIYIPLFFYILSPYLTFLGQPFFVLFSILAFLPVNFGLFTVFFITLTLLSITNQKFGLLKFNQTQILNFLYSLIFIVLFSYNPYFFIGKFDTIEEGFWLAWVYRLIDHQSLYSQVLAYHPPAIPILMAQFLKYFGANLYNSRLFFEILRLLALFIIYVSSSRFIKDIRYRVLFFILISVLTTSSFVRNNIEFRLSIGLLSLYFAPASLFLSGLLAALSFFISPDIGLVSLVSLSVFVVFFHRRRLVNFILGTIIGASPFIIYLFLNHNLSPFLSQVFFYAQSFSHGYFNTPLVQPDTLSFFYLHIANQYFPSLWFHWLLIVFTLTISVIYLVPKFFKKEFDINDRVYFLLLIFTALSFRSSLGRSDFYHLLFSLIPALILLFALIEKLTLNLNKYSFLIFAAVIVFIYRVPLFEHYFDQLITNLQSNPSVSSDYLSSSHPRFNLTAAPLDYPTKYFELLKYIEDNSAPSDKIFAFPWQPEIYFMSNRTNATNNDTPYAFYTAKYQQDTVNQLITNQPKFIIFDPTMNFGNMSNSHLPILDNYIKSNFKLSQEFGNYRVLTPIN